MHSSICCRYSMRYKIPRLLPIDTFRSELGLKLHGSWKTVCSPTDCAWMRAAARLGGQLAFTGQTAFPARLPVCSFRVPVGLPASRTLQLPMALLLAGGGGGGGGRGGAMDLEIVEGVFNEAELEMRRLAHELACGHDLVDDETGLE